MTEPQTCDLFVIGGGINGAGIARDAAGRGLSVISPRAPPPAPASSSMADCAISNTTSSAWCARR